MLSVIVPVYNMRNFLERCINSLLQQTYKNMEIILVDDGSNDGSEKLCELLKDKNKNILVLHKKNGGLISAWQNGVEFASGDYVGFVDPDDLVAPNYFEFLMEPFKKHPDCDISICGYTECGENNREIKPLKKDYFQNVIDGESLEILKINYFSSGLLNSRCVKIFKKEIIKKSMLFIDKRITIGEDLVTSFCCVLDSKKICIVNDSFGYLYQVIESSMSHNFSQKLIDNCILLKNNILNIAISKSYYNKTVNYEIIKQLISVIGLILFSKSSVVDKLKYLASLHSKMQEMQEQNIISSDYGLSLSWKFIYILFLHKMFRTLIFLSKLHLILKYKIMR